MRGHWSRLLGEPRDEVRRVSWAWLVEEASNQMTDLTWADERWLWRGSQTHNGYGHLMRGYKEFLAHRWAYERAVGPVPAGLQLDHLCRVRLCVNPAHLEPVTPRENSRRGANGVMKTTCAHGHPKTEEFGRPDADGHWNCRPCAADATRRLRARTHTPTGREWWDGSGHSNAKLDPESVRSIRARAATGEQIRDIAADLGIHPSVASRVVRRLAWANVE